MSTKIEWVKNPDGTKGETWNPITGCTPISAGCAHCYAKRMSKRLAGRFGYPAAPHNFDVTIHRDKMDLPYSWRKPRRIFVCSMGDLFHETVPGRWIEAVFDVIRHTPRHTYQILTKRPERAKKLSFLWCDDGKPISNVHLGVTPEDQKQVDIRIPILLQIPASVRFASIEPMLGPVDIRKHLPYEIDSGGFDPQGFPISLGRRPGLDWIIVGAETGPGKRPMDLRWARDVRDQCQAAGVPFFFKKDSDGRHTLDGRTWEQFPEVNDAD